MSHTDTETHFAPAGRRSRAEVDEEIRHVVTQPLIAALVKSMQGLIAVLNEERQILAVSDAFLEQIGITDGTAIFGLRPGEALGCVHAGEMPGGCGTSRYCSTCGAAVAVVAALAGRPGSERKCVITSDRGPRLGTFCFLVRATLFELDELRLVLLWAQDVSQAERWAMLERAFFHDIGNLATAVSHTTELLRSPHVDPGERRELTEALSNLATRLVRELKIQRRLTAADVQELRPSRQTVRVREVVQELQAFAVSHSLGSEVRLTVDGPVPELTFVTDLTCTLRVLTNMLVNALEASRPGDTIRIKAEAAAGRLLFSVWNRQPVPADVAQRIFEYHFSTKPGHGRGLGTYAMRVLGTEVLGGVVDFVTSETEGTTFRFSLPLETSPR